MTLSSGFAILTMFQVWQMDRHRVCDRQVEGVLRQEQRCRLPSRRTLDRKADLQGERHLRRDEGRRSFHGIPFGYHNRTNNEYVKRIERIDQIQKDSLKSDNISLLQ